MQVPVFYTRYTQKAMQVLNTLEDASILSNYFQGWLNGQFVEYQYCYHSKQWYQFKTVGSSETPTEIFVQYI